VREIDDLPATVWWGVQVRQTSLHTCTVQCTRAGILCSSVLAEILGLAQLNYLITNYVFTLVTIDMLAEHRQEPSLNDVNESTQTHHK
jgi:hypothetical protein